MRNSLAACRPERPVRRWDVTAGRGAAAAPIAADLAASARTVLDRVRVRRGLVTAIALDARKAQRQTALV